MNFEEEHTESESDPDVTSESNRKSSRYRLREGVEIITALRAAAAKDLVEESLVDRLDELLSSYANKEEEMEGDYSLARVIHRLVNSVERLEPYIQRGIDNEEASVEAARDVADAQRMREKTIATVATPRNMFFALVAVSVIIGGLIGLPVVEIIRALGEIFWPG